MDILRREIDEIYKAQVLDACELDAERLEECLRRVGVMSEIDGACRVVTDASADTSYMFNGRTGSYLGIAGGSLLRQTIDSSDEDELYMRLHPRDLVEKRMLEYEFFKFVDSLPEDLKCSYKATCRIRIANNDGGYTWIDNSTRMLELSPCGKFWLILCSYAVSPYGAPGNGISPAIINELTGEVRSMSFAEKRATVLSAREKEILLLIGEGLMSKEIAVRLGISVNTVNRHRQNILEKLSVDTSIEALNAAQAMGVL